MRGRRGRKEGGSLGRWRREMKRKEVDSEREEEGGTKEGLGFKWTEGKS